MIYLLTKSLYGHYFTDIKFRKLNVSVNLFIFDYMLRESVLFGLENFNYFAWLIFAGAQYGLNVSHTLNLKNKELIAKSSLPVTRQSVLSILPAMQAIEK